MTNLAHKSTYKGNTMDVSNLKFNPPTVSSPFPVLKAENRVSDPGTYAAGSYSGDLNGIIYSPSRDPELLGENKWRTYDRIYREVTTVSSATDLFIDIIGGSEPSLKAGPGDDKDESAKTFMEKALFQSSITSWEDQNRNNAWAKMNGFGVSEWLWRREGNDFLLADVLPIAARTVRKFNPNPDNSDFVSLVQKKGKSGGTVTIEREILLYIVEQTPESGFWGIGNYYKIAEDAIKLLELELIENTAQVYNTAGIPIAYVPYGEMRREQRQNPKISNDVIRTRAKPLHDWIKSQKRGGEVPSLVLDGIPWFDLSDASKPIAMRQYAIELLQGSGVGLTDLRAMIESVKRDLARVYRLEGLLLGDGPMGNRNLGETKDNNFKAGADTFNRSMAKSQNRDIVRPIALLNNMPEEKIPTLEYKSVEDKNLTQIAEGYKAIIDGVRYGLHPQDPANNHIRNEYGIPELPQDLAEIMAKNRQISYLDANGNPIEITPQPQQNPNQQDEEDE